MVNHPVAAFAQLGRLGEFNVVVKSVSIPNGKNTLIQVETEEGLKGDLLFPLILEEDNTPEVGDVAFVRGIVTKLGEGTFKMVCEVMDMEVD